MRGTICFIIFAVTVDIHTGDGSIITYIPSGMSWDTKGENRLGMLMKMLLNDKL